MGGARQSIFAETGSIHMPHDYYRILGLPANATEDEISRRYRDLVRENHPDVNRTTGAKERLALINKAFSVLRHSDKRREYDDLYRRSRFSDRAHKPIDYESGGGQRAVEQKPAKPAISPVAPKSGRPATSPVVPKAKTSPGLEADRKSSKPGSDRVVRPDPTSAGKPRECCELLSVPGPVPAADGLLRCDPACPLRRADNALKAGRLETAGELARTHLKKNGASRAAFEILGDVLARQHDRGRALTVYQAALLLSPENSLLQAKIRMLNAFAVEPSSGSVEASSNSPAVRSAEPKSQTPGEPRPILARLLDALGWKRPED